MASLVMGLYVMVNYIPLGMGLAIGCLIVHGTWKLLKTICGYHIRQYVAFIAAKATASGGETDEGTKKKRSD